MKGGRRTCSLLVICLCVCTRLAIVQAQIAVGFGQAITAVFEGIETPLQVTHTGSNMNDIDVTATPMTYAQFNASMDIESLPSAVQDAIARIQDPAEYDSDPSGKRDFNNTPIAFTFTSGGDPVFNIQAGDIVFDDSVNEATEGFIIVLSITSPSMDGSNAVRLNEFNGILVVQIRDNDRIQLGFENTTYSFSESAGNTADNIRIVNQNNMESEIDIPLELMINMYTTAEEGSGGDYNLTTMYTFTPNDTEIVIPITIVEDDVTEGDEVLVLSLTTDLVISTVSLDPASANVTIMDNDVVNVSLSASPLSVDEGGSVTLMVQLMGEAEIPITVQLNTADGTATASDDYVALVNTDLVIQPGFSAASDTVMINTDNERESDETFTVTMTSSSAYAQVVAGMEQVTVTIQDVVPATTSVPTATPASTPGGRRDDGDDEGLSGGAVAGIVIGILILVAIVVGIPIVFLLILFFFWRLKQTGGKKEKTEPAVSVQKTEVESEEPEVTIQPVEEEEKEETQ